MKRALSLGAAALWLLAACAAPPPAAEVRKQRQEAWQLHTEPVTLTMTSQITEDKQEGYHPPAWGEDAVSRRIMDLTGVKLDIRHQGYGTAVDVEALIAAGEITDLICTFSARTATFLEDESLCRPLDELAEAYCPEFFDGVDELQRLNNQAPDGHIYTLRNGSYTQAVYADPRIPVAPPWTLNLNRLILGGQALPASVEELEALLYRAGQQEGVVPLVLLDAAESPIPGWMGVHRDLYWDPERRTVRTPFTDEGWLDYAKLLNRWYRQGLVAMPGEEELALDPYGGPETWLEQTLPQTLAFAAPQRYAYQGSLYRGTAREDDPWPWAILTQPLTHQGQVRLIAADNRAGWGYDPVGFTAGARGMAYTSSALFITQACAHPDRALYLMEFLKDGQGAQLTHWGVEGLHYTRDEEGLIAYLDPYRTDPGYDFDAGLIFNTVDDNDGLQYWRFVGNDWAGGLLDGSPEGYVANPTLLAMRPQQIEAGLAYKKAMESHKCAALHFAHPTWGTGDYQALEAIAEGWREGFRSLVVESRDEGEVEAGWRALQQHLAGLGLPAVEQGMTARLADALPRYHEAGYYREIQP